MTAAAASSAPGRHRGGGRTSKPGWPRCSARAWQRLLLLDAPLAALDVCTKNDLRRHLRTVLRAANAPNVLVTHDLLDAVALADRMVVIEGGGIVHAGTPADVTARPRSQYVADLVGMNLLRGTANGTAVAHASARAPPSWPADRNVFRAWVAAREPGAVIRETTGDTHEDQRP
jgi:molybdate transport system ATP-binding protein